MKKKNPYPKNRIISALAATCIGLFLSGCSEQAEVEIDPYPEMSSDLHSLQGSWVDINTNDLVECTAVFQGYTIRVRYQAAPEESIQKQNASIDRLDETRDLILINGGTGAWPYIYSKDHENEQLQLEFFLSDGWHKLNLSRSE